MASLTAGSTGGGSIGAVTVSPYYKFTDCCTQEVFNLRGTINSFLNNSVYVSFVNLGGLQNGRCYTVTQLNTQDSVFWNSLPVIVNSDVSRQALNCEEASQTGKCESCEEPCNTCPEGYRQQGDECIKLETVPATYTGGLMTLVAGDKTASYNLSGIRLYDDISTYTLPIIGSGTTNANFTVKDANGTGIILPQLANVQSQLWGCNSPSACSTGSSGGRLNIAGLWANGYPYDTELCFEFCVEVLATKQYLIGVSGDNSVKIYIDGNLNVALNGNNSVTVPFTRWHVFPVTLSSGKHTIRLCGVDNGVSAAFAAEIYDIDLTTFQTTLLDPAVGAGNCGNSPSDIDDYLIFSTKDYIGKQIPNPTQPGVWQCPDGSTPDYCTGIPECNIEEKIALPICPCFLLIPCDGNQIPIISSSTELTPYLNNFVSVSLDDEIYFCVYVVDYTGDEVCQNADEVTINPNNTCPCPPKCYYISGATGVVTVNTDNELVELTSAETYPYVKLCSNTYPLVSNENNNYEIVSLGECVDGVCPTICMKLTNCEDKENVFYSNSDSLLLYAYGTNTVVTLLNKPGCWKVELSTEECDCPVDVTVLTSHQTCDDCIPVVAYKLTSCTNNDIIYTLSDLSDYVDQIVKLDCGCYTVELISILPPSPQVVVVEDSYTTCIECTRSYWLLEDCAGDRDPIITYTNLGQYEGSVIKIENCTECWKVSPTDLHIGATTVVVTNEYEDCTECGIPEICECTRVTNLNESQKTYAYYDCDNIYHEFILASGETSDKVCVLEWVQPLPFCECIKFNIYGDVYYAFIIPGEIYNDYPVYTLCTYGDSISCGYVYYENGSWVIGQDGEIFWTLSRPESNNCPYGNWSEYYSPRSKAAIDIEPNPVLTSEECDIEDFCNCFTMTQSGPTGTTTSTFYVTYYNPRSNYPTYTDGFEVINYDPESGCWYFPEFAKLYSLLCNDGECPIGEWQSGIEGVTIVTEACIEPVIEYTYLDHFETFGLCQQGICPAPELKNNRTVRPGYNTPNCNPDEYDKITCRFADVMYKIVLEKRYGITNCCPDEDEKWLLKKELIDLQAIRDPNYNCEECQCQCSANYTCQTCNCKN